MSLVMSKEQPAWLQTGSAGGINWLVTVLRLRDFHQQKQGCCIEATHVNLLPGFKITQQYVLEESSILTCLNCLQLTGESMAGKAC